MNNKNIEKYCVELESLMDAIESMRVHMCSRSFYDNIHILQGQYSSTLQNVRSIIGNIVCRIRKEKIHGSAPTPKYEIGQKVWEYSPKHTAIPSAWIIKKIGLLAPHMQAYVCQSTSWSIATATIEECHLYPTFNDALNAQIAYLESLKEQK